MKYVVVILITSFLSTGMANAQSSQIALNYEQTSLQNILKDLSKKHQLNLSWSLDKIMLDTLISIQSSHQSVEEAIGMLATSSGLQYSIIGEHIVLKMGDRDEVSTRRPEETVDRAADETMVTELPPENESPKIASIEIGRKNTLSSLSAPVFFTSPRPVKLKVFRLEKEVPQEIISINGEMSGTQVLMMAFSRLPYNYHVKPIQTSGVYREVFEENNKVAFYVEAAVDIYDHGLKEVDERKSNDEVVFLRHIRKSNNNLGRHIQGNLESFNSLIGVLKWNHIKMGDADVQKRIINEAYQLQGISEVDGRTAYKVVFIAKYPKHVFKETVFVDIKTFAVIRYERSTVADPGHYLENQFKLANDKTYKFKLKEDFSYYQFAENEGRVYLQKAGGQGKADIYNQKTKQVETEFAIQRDLNVFTMKRSKMKTKGRGLMDPNRSIFLQSSRYDQTFWNDYEDTYDQPIPLKVSEELGKYIPLENQFYKNSQ